MMEEKYWKAIDGIDEDLIMEAYLEAEGGNGKSGYKRTLSPRKIGVVILAAVLVCAFAITVVSSSNPKLVSQLAFYLGLDQGDVKELAEGIVVLDVSDSDHGVTISADTSVGDNRNAYVRFVSDLRMDDFDGMIGTEDWSMAVYRDGKQTSCGGYFEGRLEEGQVVFYMEIADAKELSHSDVSVFIKDIYLENQTTGKKQMLCEGEWNLNWTYDYDVTNVKQHVNIKLSDEKMNYHIKSLTISPLEISYSGTATVKGTLFGKDASVKQDLPEIKEVTLMDGTKIDATQSGGGHIGSGAHIGYRIGSYVNLGQLGRTVRAEEIYSITIEDEEIVLE